MNNRITDELFSFLKDYAAEPTPRDSAIARHFYNLALEDVKKECERRRKLATEKIVESSTKEVKLMFGGRIGAYTHIIIDFINNQKAE